jgi:hypothetical protein
VVWLEKHLWNVSVLQRVHVSNLVPIIIIIKVVYFVTLLKIESYTF